MEEGNEDDSETFTRTHVLVLILFFGCLILKPVASLTLGWKMTEMNSLNLGTAGLLMIVLKQDPNKSMKIFLSGSMKILPAAMAVGASAGISLLLSQGKITDTIVHAIAGVLDNKSAMLTLTLVFIFIVAFDSIMSSGSGKAVILMPIFGPLGDLLSINRQIMAHAYVWADGFSNYLWAGALALCEMCDVNYAHWFKYAIKNMAMLGLAGLILLYIAQGFNFGPF